MAGDLRASSEQTKEPCQAGSRGGSIPHRGARLILYRQEPVTGAAISSGLEVPGLLSTFADLQANVCAL